MKGSNTFTHAKFSDDSAPEVKGSRTELKYRIIRTFSSIHSHVYSVTLQRVLEYNFTEMLLQESKVVDKEFVNFPY